MYGIAEWYGHDFTTLTPVDRQRLAVSAAEGRKDQPCPFRGGTCTKAGGVCSLRVYERAGDRIMPTASPCIATCPRRFEQDSTIVRWLAEIVGLDAEAVMVAREVPFMVSRAGKPAGKIDFVVANDDAGLRWFGLEVQSVYFSGDGMAPEFAALRVDDGERPPFPVGRRHPDWRSSTAKRLMPQLQAKVPTLARWGARIAVAVDSVLFDEVMGGPSPSPSQDIDSGDVIWMVSELRAGELRRHHWEVLDLAESSQRLLAADPIARDDFEARLRRMLRPAELGGSP